MEEAQPSDAYYCGKCRRQQPTAEGQRCRLCGRVTVVWHTTYEAESDALHRWNEAHGVKRR